MRNFAKLLNDLFFTHSNLAKTTLLKEYYQNTPDPDRGLALAILTGSLEITFFKRSMVKDLIQAKVDPYLFKLSYDYVGDLSETAALLWPINTNKIFMHLPTLSQFIEKMSTLTKDECKQYLADILDNCSASERWAILKLGTGGLRIGVATRFIKQTLAQYGNKDIHEIEKIWHGLKIPYLPLFAWLEDKAPKPEINHSVFFHPVMLAHPLEESDLININPSQFILERKFDGIRVQLVCTSQGKAVYTRTGDDISDTFPDVLELLSSPVVLDGELVIKINGEIGSFNNLQQRLNRKKPSKKLLKDSPGHIILYDILMENQEDLRDLTYIARREKLKNWFNQFKPENMSISEILPFNSDDKLIEIRNNVIQEKNIAVEGLMIKRKESAYIAGRPTGHWYKWKRDPLLIDAILMYAQRGHGKRSSFYSDYTFGLWQDKELLPIGKAYSGFTDVELTQLDKWIRHHTLQSYGPVREVEKELVLEVAFDAVNLSKRHKSGVALRFPRIHRIRWDKPAIEANHLIDLKRLIIS